MSDYINHNYRRPIVTTGIPYQQQAGNQAQTPAIQGTSFEEVLSNQIKLNSSIEFSKHAFQRIVERNIDVSTDKLARLDEGIRLAQNKGLNETLILVDSTAFVVNVRNNKVITTVNEDSLKGNVFTNIDGTVIV